MVVNAIVLINVEAGKINQIAEHIVKIEGVRDVFSVAGQYDLAVILYAKSNEHVAEIVTKSVQGQEGITHTTTLLAFKSYDRESLEGTFSIGMNENA